MMAGIPLETPTELPMSATSRLHFVSRSNRERTSILLIPEDKIYSRHGSDFPISRCTHLPPKYSFPRALTPKGEGKKQPVAAFPSKKLEAIQVYSK